jgi:hypothetical protein
MLKAYMETQEIDCFCLSLTQIGENMPKINVPKWGQPNDYNCVPTSIKMILEHLRMNMATKFHVTQ